MEAVALRKDFWGEVALDGLTLDVGQGERVLLAGPNGSGKTTLLRLAAGLLDPTAGRVRVLGAEAGSLEARALTSYLPDRPVLYDDLSLAEQLEYVARLHAAAEWERRAGLLLSALGLEARADDLPSGFSHGQRQRAGLALALVRPFRLLLLDEPFNGLDPGGREALLAVLDDVAGAGAAVVLVSHGLDYLEQATRCVGLVDGHLAYDGPATADAIQRLVG
jgi:ABC-type multidrug transport system ATPase subunit